MNAPVDGAALVPDRPRRRGIADTGPRFALLMTVVTVSSVSMLDTVLAPKPNDTPGDPLGCLLAAGLDPDGRNVDNVLSTERSSEALSKCMSGVPTVEHWKGMVATLLLLAVAAAVYWWTPRLRELRHRTVPVGDVDRDGTLAAELAELRARAGITYGLAFRVDPARTTAGAVVYGRFGQYTVCLHAGLLVRRSTDPEGFRAVVLHEFAHIRNRDVDFASASTALWRVFVVLALLPYLYHEGRLLLRGLFGLTDSPFWPGAASILAYSLLAGLVLVGLVPLARADLLRRRELHADAGAVDCGAPPAAWQHRDPPGTVAASMRRVTALLRTHPTWAERRRALADHTRLSGVGALSMFLVGVSATLLVNELQVVPGLSADSGAAWCTAAFMAPMLWFPLARSVAASQGTGRGESGVRSGMWLGCGLILGEFARGRHGNEWLAPEPWFLLGLLLAATVAAVWSAQCTRLALALPRRWARWAAGLLNLLVVAAVLGAGLRWWYWSGQYLAVGLHDRTDLLRHQMTSMYPGTWQAYSWELSAVAMLLPNLVDFTTSIPVEAAALALWLLPLVVWACTGAPGLRVRRTLLAGLAGGALCWAGLLAAGYVQHGRRPGSWAERTGAYSFFHTWLVMGAILASSLLTAAAVAAVSRHFWLPRALLAAAVAQLLGMAGWFVLFSADGCLGRYSFLTDRCQWVPAVGLSQIDMLTRTILAPTILFAGCAGLVGAGVGWGVRRVRRGSHVRPAPADHPDETPGRAQTPPPPPVVPAQRGLRLLSSGLVLVLAVSASLLTVAAHESSPGAKPASASVPADTPGDTVDDLVDAPPTARTAKIREWQARAWLGHGGLTHSKRIVDAATDISDAFAAAVQKPRDNGETMLETKKFSRLCGALAKRADDALAYFPVPDKNLQKTWSVTLKGIARQGRICQDAMTPGDADPYRTEADRARVFNQALDEIFDALDPLVAVLDKITKLATSST
ncbi:M48 family metalloprotease [Streptomyces cellulosae]|uniref:M48 family metalloprotease n=1 Tax=Streptomyces cellulosae TaxID=1968 RepID=UPI00131BE084|nr:M48 family metalloprotease [Streptomyces cellulosae]